MNDVVAEICAVTGGRLAYRRWRAVERGNTPLILLHGFTGCSLAWRPLAARFSRTRDVIAFDLPGHGATELGTLGSACDMAAFSTAFDDALDLLSIEGFDLLGYSMGGRTALYLALADTSSAKRLRRLVLESASAGLATEAEREARRLDDEALIRVLLEEGVERFVDGWERTPVLSGQRRLPARERSLLRAQRLACDASGLAASLQGMGAGAQPWLGEALASLSRPTLCIAGADDAKFAAIAERLAQAIPDCRLALIAGCGHSPHMEDPESYLAIADAFLAADSNRESILNAC